MQNRGPATFYVPGEKLNETCLTPLRQQLEDEYTGKSTKLSPKSTKLNEDSAELAAKIASLSDELQNRIKSLRKKENSDIVQNLIEAICYEITMSTEELAALLGRNPKALYREHISVLVQKNKLFQANPSNKTDPKQAYTSRKE